MLDPEIKREIAGAEIDAPCTFILEWRATPDAAAFAAASSKRERLQRLTDFYRELKRPWLDELSRNVDVSITDLPASGQAIVTANAATWRDLLSDLERAADVRLLPNAKFHTLQ
jgi:hypothetical protein